MRLIDADVLIADMQERYCKPCKEKGEDYHEVRCRACWVDDAINDVDGFADNSIDIEPKRGEWIDREQCQIDEDGYDVAICSNCKEEITIDPRHDNFCPNCGCAMTTERQRLVGKSWMDALTTEEQAELLADCPWL